jgi:ubiquitin-conjugating enzyme E2 D/E
MSSSRDKAIKRLTSEYAQLCREPIARCTAEPKSQSDFFSWKAAIEGPPDTAYAGGKFNLEFTFPEDYPFTPPQVKMITKCFHPNIFDTHVCVDILKTAWSPALGVTQVLLSLSSLLSDPNPASALNGEAAQLFVKNRKAYDATVREWVQKHASCPKTSAPQSSAAAVPAAAAGRRLPPPSVPSSFTRDALYPPAAVFRIVQRDDADWEPDSSQAICPGPGCGKHFIVVWNPRHHCRFPLHFLLFCFLFSHCI